MTLHIHLAGAPCMGKSVTAAQVFARLRLLGISAELVQEYAKEKCWEGTLADTTQFLTAAEQTRREAFLEGKVDVIVSDSPPLLGALYAAASFRYELETCIARTQDAWTRLTYVLFHDLSVLPYESTGRREDHEQSLQLHLHLIQMLARQQIPYRVFDTTPVQAPDRPTIQSSSRVMRSHLGQPTTLDQTVEHIVSDTLEAMGMTSRMAGEG